MSRKVKGSHAREQVMRRVAIRYEHIANQHQDFHHQLSRQLVNRFGCIAVESLNISGMLNNHTLAKAIADAGWAQFLSFTSYKMAWVGGTVPRVDKFFPSSKLCSVCGEPHYHLTLSMRQWACLNCQTVHDRDHNASLNILMHATAGTAESHAMGDTSVQSGIRPSKPTDLSRG